MSNRIQLPAVQPFDHLKDDKPLGIKVLEEAAELSVSTSTLIKSRAMSGTTPDNLRTDMLDEFADVCQTLGNLAVAFRFTTEEITQAMYRCDQRNIKRGRITR